MVVIYIFTFPNSKKYIGQTTNLEKRYREHNNGKKYPIDRAIKKYGWDNIEKEYEEVPDEFLDLIEIGMIKSCDCKDPNGYNLTDGGKGAKGYKHTNKWKEEKSIEVKNSFTIERRKEQSDKLKKNKNALGHKISEEHKKIISLRNKGKIVLKETRDQISKNMIGKNIWSKNNNNATKKVVLQFDKQNNFIRRWESISKAEKELKITNIWGVINNRQKTAGGFIWRE